MLLNWLVALPLSLAAICPLQNHQVCNVRNNEDHHHIGNQHQCTCAITPLSDLPAPEQSCSNLITRSAEDGTFPVISLTLNLKESPEIDKFPEGSFRDTIAGSLRINPADVLILRVNCQGTNDFLTVQFAVLKKYTLRDAKVNKSGKATMHDDSNDDYDDGDNNEKHEENGAKKNANGDFEEESKDDHDDGIKYDTVMFIDAESVAARMKAMGHLSQIADLQVDSIEFTKYLIDLEYHPDNSTLILQVVAVVVSITLMMLIGILATCRHRDYSDDLQKN